MQLQDIFRQFKQLKTSPEKVEFLQDLQSKNLPYHINYANLIKYWSEH